MCAPPSLGQTGKRTAVIFLVMVLFEPTVVVRLRTVSTTWISPQRSTCTAVPGACFHCVTIFFFGGAAAAPTVGSTSAAALTTAVTRALTSTDPPKA